jgi:hypothetical protein
MIQDYYRPWANIGVQDQVQHDILDDGQEDKDMDGVEES